MSFDRAFEKTVGLEGGYGCDPDDSGNWTGGKIGVGELKGTKYGLSTASYPEEDIKNLTLERAEIIYKRDFWDPLHLDQVTDSQIAEEIFDTAVNTSAPRTPITVGKIVQRAINFLEPGALDAPLEVDGIIGPTTMFYINKWCREDPEALFKALNGEQYAYYKECEYHNPIKKKFAWGWMKRIQSYRRG